MRVASSAGPDERDEPAGVDLAVPVRSAVQAHDEVVGHRVSSGSRARRGPGRELVADRKRVGSPSALSCGRRS